ncbi:MAG: hypothetical protein DHS20C15_11890 [Planctomycetota bacterium]|nr:MAG: hypothetical protein DHS20C15_11890 [Planctomycetota bacterium]
MNVAQRRHASLLNRVGVVLVAALCAFVGSCAPGGEGSDNSSVIVRFDPPVPEVGTARLEVRLVDAAGEPLAGGELSLEANMTHAGMQPTFATLTESFDQAGVYTGDVEFTMGGDWFLLLNAAFPDGRELERTLDVPGVRAP